MKRTLTVMSVAGLLAIVMTAVGVSDEKPKQDPSDMAKMMEAFQKAQKYINPGDNHKLLNKFIGEWKTESRFFMGSQPTPAEPGEATTKWLIDGRWIVTESKGQLMGKPSEMYTTMGYDNFKMSFVATTVSNWDTAMNRAEGDMDPGGKALLMYGTIDEYLTGEHDKMVKLVYRFISDDKIVMEIHDLPIGEKNTKVVEITYTRK